MLLVGYCFGIRSWSAACAGKSISTWPTAGSAGWGLDSEVPDHSTFSKNRHGRFRDSDLLRQVFETVVARCMAGEGWWAAKASRLTPA